MLKSFRTFTVSTVIACLVASATWAVAQTTGGEAVPDPVVNEPVEGRRVVVRFLTEGDYPPFNYYDDEGILTGFNVDLARAICLEMSAACDVRVRPWDELFLALKRGEADAVIAGHAVSSTAMAEVDFSDRYLHTPGRFVGKTDGQKNEISPEGLDGMRIGVAKGTTHEAYLKAFFRDSRIQPYENADLAREALQQGKVDYVFDDSISLTFWLGGTLSRHCCEFKGSAYFEPKFFGDGMGIAISQKDPQLKMLINMALKRVRQSGRFDELVERYFPIRIY
jgi:polar amino acid transport system substrate-binding protein